MMYHGAVMAGRGIENLIRLLTVNPDIVGICLGNTQVPSYLESLRKLAKDLNVADRMIFHPAVPYKDLWKLAGAVDIAFMALDASCQSYYWSLPNKFFESIQALTPGVYADFPEYRRIVDEYKTGIICDSADVYTVSEAVEKLRTDKEFYRQCKANLRKAKEVFHWDNEKAPLEEAYRRLLE